MEESRKGTLLALVTEQLVKTEDQKSLEMLSDLVEENLNAFQNDLFAAKKESKAAAKYAESLEANVNASATDIINAARQLAVAEKNVTDLEAIIARRF